MSNLRLTTYLTGVVQRDIRDLAEIEGLREIPNLLSLIAARNAGLLNLASISGEIALSRPTVTRYFALLKATFLVETLPAWAKSQAKRLPNHQPRGLTSPWWPVRGQTTRVVETDW